MMCCCMTTHVLGDHLDFDAADKLPKPPKLNDKEKELVKSVWEAVVPKTGEQSTPFIDLLIDHIYHRDRKIVIYIGSALLESQNSYGEKGGKTGKNYSKASLYDEKSDKSVPAIPVKNKMAQVSSVLLLMHRIIRKSLEKDAHVDTDTATDLDDAASLSTIRSRSSGKNSSVMSKEVTNLKDSKSLSKQPSTSDKNLSVKSKEVTNRKDSKRLSKQPSFSRVSSTTSLSNKNRSAINELVSGELNVVVKRSSNATAFSTPVSCETECNTPKEPNVESSQPTTAESRLLLSKGFVPTFDFECLPENEDQALTLADLFLNLFKEHVTAIYRSLHELIMLLNKDDEFDKLTVEYNTKHKTIPAISKAHFRTIFDAMDAAFSDFLTTKFYDIKHRRAVRKFLQCVYLIMSNGMRATDINQLRN